MATAAAVRHRDIDDATLAVLASMRVDGQVVLPYAEKLDRDAYLRLNKVLEALGGKWKRGKGHVFDGDPSERIEAAVATGSYACPKLSGFDFFPTPDEIVDRLLYAAKIQDGMKVLEPSAGDGAIADAIRDNYKVDLTVIELDPKRAAALTRKGYDPTLLRGDFLEFAAGWAGCIAGFDRIVMNPPFSKKQDIAHVRAAYDLLAPGGRLVAILSAGFGFRQDKATAELRTLVEKWGNWFALPDGSFEEAGTGVNTVLAWVEKPAGGVGPDAYTSHGPVEFKSVR